VCAEVPIARQLRDELGGKKNAGNRLKAALTSGYLGLSSFLGVNEKMITELKAAIAVHAEAVGETVSSGDADVVADADLKKRAAAIAKEHSAQGRVSGLSIGEGVLKEAQALLKRLEAQLAVQVLLEQALMSTQEAAMRAAIGEADSLNLKITLVSEVRAKMKSMRKMKTHQRTAMNELLRVTKDVKDELDNKAKSASDIEAEVQEKLSDASDGRYHMSHLAALREPADFTRGHSNRKRALAQHLVFQEQPLHTSLVDTSFVEKRKAVTIHKSLLGYCGHMKMAYTPTLAHEILEQGHAAQKAHFKNWLVDEIYCQLCKHLTDNPSPRSTWLGWQLLVMTMMTFPPTPDFEKCLLHFIGTTVNKSSNTADAGGDAAAADASSSSADVGGREHAESVARSCAQDAIKILPALLARKPVSEIMSVDRIKQGGFLTLPIPEPVDDKPPATSTTATGAGATTSASKLGTFLSSGAASAPKKVDWSSI
jgi:hypothetical protein